MKKVAIVGVEGSGKTVMLAGLGELYTNPDKTGYFLAPKNFGTAAYVAEKIARMRKGEWPTATAGDEMQGLNWTLSRQTEGGRGRPEDVCEVSFLDFPGEVYRAAYGISGGGNASLKDQVASLKQYVRGADDLIVLINLRDVIASGIDDQRVQEAMWITKSILDTALGERGRKDAPRAAIVLSQADSYAGTIKACGGARGVLQKYLPHVAAQYGWLDVFTASAVDKTVLNDDGNAVPAADFTTRGLLPIMQWICGGGSRWSRPAPGSRSCATVAVLAVAFLAIVGGVWLWWHSGRGAREAGRAMAEWEQRERRGADAADKGYTKVQLWAEGPYWADMNIGAETPWESGYHFSWGDVVGYKYENDVWLSSDESLSGFKLGSNTLIGGRSELQSKGWIAADGTLASEYDAAHVMWRGRWRLPTKQELEDLGKRCDWTWTTMNGVNGYVVRGRGDYAAASIFLPAAGIGHGTSLNDVGSYGYYWSSVPSSDTYSSYAWHLYFSSSGHLTYDDVRRYNGLSVRPVQGFTKKRTK